MEAHDLLVRKIVMVASMASAASLSAAKFAHEYRVDREHSIETVMRFVEAGFKAN